MKNKYKEQVTDRGSDLIFEVLLSLKEARNHTGLTNLPTDVPCDIRKLFINNLLFKE